MSIVIGEGTDPLSFLISQFSGNIVDSTNSNAQVQVLTQFPRSLGKLPMVVVKQGKQTTRWISIPNYRQRWYSPYMVEIYTFSPTQRYAIELSLRSYIKSITKPPAQQLASNYVFLEITGEAVPDQPMVLGTPMYRSLIPLRLIYDKLYM